MRAEIIKAAREIIGNEGVDKVSIRKIAAKIEYSPAIIYHYFGNKEEIIEFQNLVRKVPVSEEVMKFGVEIVNKTRPETATSPKFVKDYVRWGAGPRASQYLILASKALAAIEGRYTPSKEDIITVAESVLRHRLILNFNAEADSVNVNDLVKRLFE